MSLILETIWFVIKIDTQSVLSPKLTFNLVHHQYCNATAIPTVLKVWVMTFSDFAKAFSSHKIILVVNINIL